MKRALSATYLLFVATSVFCLASRASATAEVVATPELITLGGILHPDSDDTLAFTPDGKTVFFDRSSGQHKTILVSHKVKGSWSKPQTASFSGRWFDQDPLVAPDGSYVLFDSDRPVMPNGNALVQNYFNGGRSAPGANIWKVERTGNGWGTPVWLGPVLNNDAFIDFPSVAADGTMYFIRWDSNEKIMHMWRSTYRDDGYLLPVSAGVGDATVSIHDPAVAPDQSFMVFDYGKVKGGLGRLCIAFREGDQWSKPVDLGDVVNKDIPWGAHLAPDGHTVYYTGQSGIWQLSLTPWLQSRHQLDAQTAIPTK
jgi:hypothetical protein